jgi:hypothetical protein
MLNLIRFSISFVAVIGLIMVGCGGDELENASAGKAGSGAISVPSNPGSTTNNGNSTTSNTGSSSNTGSTDNTTPNTPVCGNGVKEGTEECDVNAFGGDTCESMGTGFTGDLSCKDDCTIDDSMCVAADSADSGYGGGIGLNGDI